MFKISLSIRYIVLMWQVFYALGNLSHSQFYNAFLKERMPMGRKGAIGKWTILNKVSYVGFVRITCIDSLILLCYHNIN